MIAPRLGQQVYDIGYSTRVEVVEPGSPYDWYGPELPAIDAGAFVGPPSPGYGGQALWILGLIALLFVMGSKKS